MKQSKVMSLLESVLNIAIGFGISLLAQIFFLPLLGVEISFRQNFAFALIMTVISIVRSFCLRRLFEALRIRRPLSPFMLAVIAERFRQIEVEGWSTEHDDGHQHGDLARAGACYLLAFAARSGTEFDKYVRREICRLWPWHKDWWKPRPDEPRRDAVRGVALAIAEGEKFDRLKTKARAS